MSEANETRGEISLELGGAKYVLRPSYEAIQSIEKKTGRGLIALARECSNGSLSLGDVALIVAECVRAYGRAHDDRHLAASSAERFAEMILDSDGGLLVAADRIALLLMLAATGGYTAAGELKPARASQQATE